MGRKLPGGFARYAEDLARVNPAAFESPDDARKTLKRLYKMLVAHDSTTAVSTGGVLLRKTGDGDEIEMWVLPKFMAVSP